MRNPILILSCLALALFAGCQPPSKHLTDYVNPFLGTATLWEPEDLGYVRQIKERTWGAEVFPGASVPNSMVQLSPVTQYRSGAGYQYEDSVIYGFSHTNKGHWNLLHIPMLPITGEDVDPNDFKSGYSHDNETAAPGYYQVYLERYGINAELTTTLRCGFHRYTFPSDSDKRLLADLTRSNNRVHDWSIRQESEYVFVGNQNLGGEGNMFFYAVSNYPITAVEQVRKGEREVSVVNFTDSKGKKPLELKIGFSFVSIENAKANLEAEMLEKSFAQVRKEATQTWETLLSHIQVTGGTEREKGLFYSTLYRSFLWPVLRSDVNGDFTDARGEVVNEGFDYYTDPSFWDDYRNKLVLLAMISPEVTTDVIKSCIDRGEKRGGFMPTFFHGDHALAFVAGSYLRGVTDFDLQRAYKLMLNNAFNTERNRIRPHLAKYIELGYVPEQDLSKVATHKVANAAVTKTQEYAYDDYALALLAKELGDTDTYETLMKRSANYRNVFDASTGFMRGRLENGEWVKEFDPGFPYYEYMYREANAWQSIFFAPHDTEGLLDLFPDRQAAEQKLDSVFTIPWGGYEAHNMTGFIGQYCHGNQPDHSYPYVYYFLGKQEKGQAIINKLLDEFYDMGADKLAYCGMDDAGEMSSWYVFNAMGLYTYSPADPEYIVTVPLFDTVSFQMGDGSKFQIRKEGEGQKIQQITYDDQPIDGWFVTHDQLKQGKELVIKVE